LPLARKSAIRSQPLFQSIFASCNPCINIHSSPPPPWLLSLYFLVKSNPGSIPGGTAFSEK
jgi:hypothetical protein